MWAYKLENEATWAKAALASRLQNLGEETSAVQQLKNMRLMLELGEKVKLLQGSIAGKSEKRAGCIVRAGVQELHDWVKQQGTACAGWPSGASKAPRYFNFFFKIIYF